MSGPLGKAQIRHFNERSIASQLRPFHVKLRPPRRTSCPASTKSHPEGCLHVAARWAKQGPPRAASDAPGLMDFWTTRSDMAGKGGQKLAGKSIKLHEAPPPPAQ